MSALDFEEAGHKLMKIQVDPGREIEVVTMILECCSQEKTYIRCVRMMLCPTMALQGGCTKALNLTNSLANFIAHECPCFQAASGIPPALMQCTHRSASGRSACTASWCWPTAALRRMSTPLRPECVPVLPECAGAMYITKLSTVSCSCRYLGCWRSGSATSNHAEPTSPTFDQNVFRYPLTNPKP